MARSNRAAPWCDRVPQPTLVFRNGRR